MLIACPECATKFRVNPERIPAAGAKVRCARCKHIFQVQKPVVEEPVVEEPAHQTEQSDFSYEQFQQLDTDSSDDYFSFGDEEEELTAEPTQLATDTTEESEADNKPEETFSFDAPTEESARDEHTGLKPEHMEEIFGTDDEPAEEETSQSQEKIAQPVQKTKGGVGSRIFRLLLLLILGLVAVAGALYYLNGPEQMNQAIQQFLDQQTTAVETGRITLTNLEGKFVKNQEAGELFIIRGEATNDYQTARAAIQVKGVIFDQAGKQLLQKTIYCGNPISDQELQTLPFSKLEEMMRNQFGKSLKNMKINSKETIPFVIVFRDLPENIAEFSVDVTSSEAAGK